MQQQDRIKSLRLVSGNFLNNSFQMIRKVSPLVDTPNSPFIWLLAIIKLVADVNPETTGVDTNSTKNPKCKMPNNSVTHPDKKQRSTT